mmetsp:Transcript_16361/g.62077  ORF Transcript_16361/g.62077 Transcript_16361/m.62077 type:complete len:226 (+) Transcript_16361:689-1366(+)
MALAGAVSRRRSRGSHAHAKARLQRAALPKLGADHGLAGGPAGSRGHGRHLHRAGGRGDRRPRRVAVAAGRCRGCGFLELGQRPELVLGVRLVPLREAQVHPCVLGAQPVVQRKPVKQLRSPLLLALDRREHRPATFRNPNHAARTAEVVRRRGDAVGAPHNIHVGIVQRTDARQRVAASHLVQDNVRRSLLRGLGRRLACGHGQHAERLASHGTVKVVPRSITR